MTRVAAARFGLVILAVALLWTGVSFVSQRTIVVWSETPASGDGGAYTGTDVDVLGLGLVLLALGVVITATVLVFEAYVRPMREVSRRDSDTVARAHVGS